MATISNAGSRSRRSVLVVLKLTTQRSLILTPFDRSRLTKVTAVIAHERSREPM
jgi:hypothetical protein